MYRNSSGGRAARSGERGGVGNHDADAAESPSTKGVTIAASSAPDHLHVELLDVVWSTAGSPIARTGSPRPTAALTPQSRETGGPVTQTGSEWPSGFVMGLGAQDSLP